MKMHWCTAKVNLSGQGFTIVVFEPSNPVSWPEAQVLIALHGDDNVFEIKPCRVADVSPSDEKRRLLGKYGHMVERVFPGRTFRMEMVMPGETVDQEKADAFTGVGIGTSQAQGIGVDGAGVGIGTSDGSESEGPLEPSIASPVFKPGKHQRPAAGA